MTCGETLAPPTRIGEGRSRFGSISVKLMIQDKSKERRKAYIITRFLYLQHFWNRFSIYYSIECWQDARPLESTAQIIVSRG